MRPWEVSLTPYRCALYDRVCGRGCGAVGCWYRCYEHYAGDGHRKNPGDRSEKSCWCNKVGDRLPVFDGIHCNLSDGGCNRSEERRVGKEWGSREMADKSYV